MPTQISRVPFGLQDLLGSTNQGDNPSQLSEIVAPTLDLSSYLEAERRSFTISTAPAAFVNGLLTTITVPLGELWLVHAVGFAAVTQGLGPHFANVSVGINQVANSSSPTSNHAIANLGQIQGTGSGAGTFLMTYDFPKPLPVFGNEKFRCELSQGDFTGVNAYRGDFVVRYTKLRV